MYEQIKKHQRVLLTVLIIICLVSILFGCICYVGILRDNLENESIREVMYVTRQQQQAFDNFISGERQRLHNYASYFSASTRMTKEAFQEQISMYQEDNSVFAVICLEHGWYCSTDHEEILQVDEEELEQLRTLSGSGVRDNYTGLFSSVPRFCYYETFTFSDGHRGLIQRSYDRSRISETFSLSFYNDHGLSHIVNENGDILLRPASVTENFYENVFDALTERFGQQDGIDRFIQALHNRETGSMVFSGDSGNLIYTYVPMENVDGWFLVSVLSENTIRAGTDKILLSSQMAVLLLGITLLACIISVLLIRRTHRDIEARDREVKYQAQLFNIFAAYLSSSFNDVYMILDHKTNTLDYVTPNVEQVLGITPEEALDRLWAEDLSIDAEATEAYYDAIHAMVPGQSLAPRTIERINPRTGVHMYFVESTSCVDIQGRIKRVACLSDRTRERQTQNSLAEALHMAQAANEAKSAFLSSVSHDIRTPMNAIIGFLGLMRDEVNNPDMVMEYNKRIDAASQHLLGLINDVLDMNKIESGGTTLSISEMNLADIVSEINTIIRPQTRAKNQTFDIAVGHLKFEHLLGDRMRINQILINLLSNAVKYTPEGGAIRLRVEELSQVVSNYSRVRFTVSDNGLGMSEDYQKVMFEPFTREETKITHEIQGTGLGMAITKSLVDLMGGTIRVESAPDRGSIFTVELELRIQEQEIDPEFWTHHRVQRMIVTDDDEEACHNIVKLMALTDVEVDYATDGETAIRMMRENREAGRPYDLILLDWKMPGLNGLETARLIRKNYSKKIPILLLTAYDWSDIEQEATEIGVNHFMPKPFFMSTFKEAIRRVMGKEKTVEDNRSDVVKGKNILVVDDIEVNRIILVKILGSLGASCDTAGNGQEAVEKFEASEPGRYDLILMDVQMPVMDGYTATRAIRGGSHPSAKAVPIIAMTANAFVDDVRDAIDSGMDAHVAKPVQLDNLKATIQQVLDSRANPQKEE